jgi:thiol-disulfide isomerase/thioredoxin
MIRPSHRTGRATILRSLLLALAGFAMIGAIAHRIAPPDRDLSRNPLVTQASYFQDAPQVNLEGGIAWINTAGPIRMEDLKGKIVLLDFWTYCCINCHHVLPDLERLEQKYAKELVVIGVHSAKFPAERETENIKKKVAEYRIKHPVINDADMVIWRKFGVNSWPTFVLIDANGRYQGFTSGEGKYELLDEVIGKLAAQHRERKELNETPLQFFPENEKSYDQPLLYPGKIHVNAEADRMFVTDTGHNRIIVADLNGTVVDVIGNGRTGFTNGTFQESTFNRPQGVYFKDDFLFVADTENHAIRVADLKNKTVKTVAGTGVQSQRREGSGKAEITGLNSPWDIVPIGSGNRFAIAMAGPHQIWELNLDKGTVGVLAGSGREDIIDGAFKAAALAQPSGLASDGENIYFADSETSSLRLLNMKKKTVETVVGKGLFDYFDGVGPIGKGKYYFQHCLGVAYADGIVYVADSYNNRIKAYDVKAKKIVPVLGTGKPGADDKGQESTLDQPGGVAVAKGKLYIADSNNHAIRVADLATGDVSTLSLKGLTKPESPIVPPTFPNAQVIRIADAKIAPDKTVALDIRLPIDGGMKLNALAPLPYTIEVKDAEGKRIGGTGVAGSQVEPPSEAFSTNLTLDKPVEAGQSLTLKVSVAAFLCKEGAEGFCLPKSYVWEVPLTVAADGSNRVSLGAAAK